MCFFVLRGIEVNEGEREISTLAVAKERSAVFGWHLPEKYGDSRKFSRLTSTSPPPQPEEGLLVTYVLLHSAIVLRSDAPNSHPNCDFDRDSVLEKESWIDIAVLLVPCVCDKYIYRICAIFLRQSLGKAPSRAMVELERE